jgi:hypothetical protein
MAHEPAIALRVLRTLLTGDGSLMGLVRSVYSRIAPTGAVMPYVVITSNGGSDTNTAGGRAFSQPTFAIKVVGIDIQQDAKGDLALDRIDTLLQNYRGTDSVSGASLTIKSTAPIPEYTENPAPATAFRHAGRYWRVTVSLPD